MDLISAIINRRQRWGAVSVYLDLAFLELAMRWAFCLSISMLSETERLCAPLYRC